VNTASADSLKVVGKMWIDKLWMKIQFKSFFLPPLNLKNRACILKPLMAAKNNSKLVRLPLSS
jgi:hypothetical protein